MPGPRTATGPGRTRPCSARRWGGCGSRPTRRGRRTSHGCTASWRGWCPTCCPRCWPSTSRGPGRCWPTRGPRCGPWPPPTRSRPRGSSCCRATPRRSWPWPPTGTTSLSAGVPERSPATLPGQAAALVGRARHPRRRTAAASARTGARPWRRGCRHTVAGVPTWPPRASRTRSSTTTCTRPTSAWHGDGVRVIDWGDASLGHPFGTMLATLNSLAHHAGLDLRAPLVLRLRDAYLEPFTAYAGAPRPRPPGRPRTAGRAGSPGRWPGARPWSTEPPEAHAEWDFPVRGWLEEILQD